MAPGLVQGRPVLILLVEDNRFDATLTVDAGAKLATRISWDIVRTGEEAIDAARQRSHDLALVDINLPGMDGYAVHDALREIRGKDLPIVLISAVDEPIPARGVRVGAELVQTKPIDSHALDRYIRAVEAVWSTDRRHHNVPAAPGWDGYDRRQQSAPPPMGGVKMFVAALAAWGAGR